jgi:hypothetical protein
MARGAVNELEEVVDDLLTLLKNPDVGAALAERGVNASIALTIVHGLEGYVAGEKARAAEDLETAAEEIRARMKAGASEKPS